MNNENRYDAIATRSRTRRTRDFAFALMLAAVAAFSIGALRSAADHVDHAPTVSAGTTALSPASCTLEPSC